MPAPPSDLAQELIKDPYSFDFLALGPAMSERELELGLLENLRALILELGKGFACVERQHHLEVGGQDFYLDLLFYHLRLRCFVVIDLKVEEFRPEFAGKMGFYLSAVDDQLRHETDAPSIGIILSRGRTRSSSSTPCETQPSLWGLPSTGSRQPFLSRFALSSPPSRNSRALPLLSLRLEIERELQISLDEHSLRERPLAIGAALAELERSGRAPSSVRPFQAALRVLN